MKLLPSILVLLLALAGTADARDMPVVRTVTRDGNSQLTGSGAIFSPGRVLTVYHNFENLSRDAKIVIEIFDKDTKRHRTIPARLVAAEPTKDLAVLRFNPKESNARPLEIAPRDYRVKRGQKVWTWGCRLGRPPTFQYTTVTSDVLEIKGLELGGFETKANEIMGRSGGPVINDKWEIIGVIAHGSSSRLEFWTADWCAPCRTVHPIADRLSRTWPVLEYDVDVSPEVVQERRIDKIPVCIMFSDNKEIGRLTGIEECTEQRMLQLLRRGSYSGLHRPLNQIWDVVTDRPASDRGWVRVQSPFSRPITRTHACRCGEAIAQMRATITQLQAEIAELRNRPAGEGPQGEQGLPGIPGKDGANGRPGRDGTNGNPGRDGKDGAFIATAQIRDGRLILIRSDGQEIDAGKLPATNPDTELSQRVTALEEQIDKPFDVQLFVNGKAATDVRSVQPHGGWLPIDLPWEVVKPRQE